MTEPEARQRVPENEPEGAAATAEAQAPEPEAEPPPEPWTAERVSEWNAYYDIYVMGAALLLAFIVSCNYVAESHIFAHLKAGQLIAARSTPVTADEFSYTVGGRPWVDVPWLFQWASAALYNFVYGLVPTDPTDPTANRARADQIAMGVLVILDALARLATVWALLKIRHRGPGAWWSALCVTLAFGVVFHPLFGILMGGIAGVPTLGPATWGQLFLALELLLLFRAFEQGRNGSLWLLIPIFLLWANADASFLTGLVVMASVVIGRVLDGETLGGLRSTPAKPVAPGEDGVPPAKSEVRPPRGTTGWIILALCAAACLVNPWTFRSYLVALDPFVRLFQPTADYLALDQLSFFGAGLREIRIEGRTLPDWYLFPVYYLILVAIGLGSFLLNSARFSWARFLPFAVMSVIWAILMRYAAEFAAVWVVVLVLNGQEWYHARLGTEGRLGRTWTLWSTGGRLVTLALIFFLISKDITGWRNTMPGLRFGLGYDPDDFAFEAAEFLERQDEIQGNVLNTSMSQGDILLWKAWPKRKTYIDGRQNLFPRELIEQWHKIRRSLSGDTVAEWEPLLNQYGISAVMIEPLASPNTYNILMRSTNWIPFYDDGRIVMFGREDAPASDLAVFKANRLDPERVYRVARPLPAAEGPPAATSWIDEVFQNRTFDRPQTRTESAWRWLKGLGGTSTEPALPEPSRCLLAIQDARIALSRSPDDWIAFRVLNEAYRYLMVQEAALLAGIPITPENRNRISAITPSPEHLMNRFRQRVTALNYAIQTTPPPRTREARQDLFNLNVELFQLYLNVGARDLGRDRLQAALELNKADEFLPPEIFSQLQEQGNQLDQTVEQVGERLEELAIENQAGPVDQAQFARSQGAVGLAISKFAEAERQSVSLALVKPQLIDLYCMTGQPDKALDLLSVGTVEDPNLGSEPGAPAYRQGMVYFLLGNYLSAASLWQDRAIPRVRFHRSERVLAASRALTHGEAMMAANELLGVPNTLGQQATWNYDLALCQLEAGLPEEAAKHLTQALTLEPNLTVRPIAAYYLEKLGKPVPPPTQREASAAAKSNLTGDPPAETMIPRDPTGRGPVPNPAATAAHGADPQPEAPRAQKASSGLAPPAPLEKEKTRGAATPSTGAP